MGFARVVPAILAAFLAGAGQEPPGGVPLLPDGLPQGFGLSGGASTESETVLATGTPFARALRVRTKTRPPRPYDAQLSARTVAPVEKGDVLLLSAWLRAAESSSETGEGQAGLVFERAGDPYTKSLDWTAGLGPEWKLLHAPFVAAERYGPGQAQFLIRVGYDPQILEVGPVKLLNYGKKVRPRDLPRTPITYPGMEPDAPWRREAAARIEFHRKGDLTVAVTDGGGRAVPGARVRVTMKRHAYGFGSAVAARLIADAGSEDGRRYRETILKLYNKVVFENDLKWGPWENAANRELTFKALGWLRECGIAVRGHCLVWPSWRHTARDLEPLKGDPAAIRRRVEEHITEEVSALAGRIDEWDVINEPYSNHDLMDVLGPEAMADWFRLARRADPRPVLYLNDYDILTRGGLQKDHQDHYEKTLRSLLDRGAPLGGVGLQGHFGLPLTAPDHVVKILDRFAALGLPLQVTEHDIDTTDEELQAAYTRDFMTAVFSHPGTAGILSWGFWEGRHWRPDGAYFRRDWSVKPAGQAWMDLVLKEWWTRAEGRTDGRGEFKVRGFLGDYEVEAEAGGRKKAAAVTLGRPGSAAKIALD